MKKIFLKAVLTAISALISVMDIIDCLKPDSDFVCYVSEVLSNAAEEVRKRMEEEDMERHFRRSVGLYKDEIDGHRILGNSGYWTGSYYPDDDCSKLEKLIKKLKEKILVLFIYILIIIIVLVVGIVLLNILKRNFF